MSLAVYASSLLKESAEYKQNQSQWGDLLAVLQEKTLYSRRQGLDVYTKRHIDRGMMLARDRIDLLLDEDSTFLELQPFIGLDLQDEPPCANLIAGIGVVVGRPVMIISHIPTSNAGAWSEYMVKKQVRNMEIATENALPVIALVQSAGVFLPNQFAIFHPGGQIFRDLVNHALAGNQSCSIVFGSGTAGGAYQPALSSHTIFVDKQAQVFLGGPPLVEQATGEKIGAEELGGAEMHSKTSGLSDILASDEFDALQKAREWAMTLGAAADASPTTHFLPPRHSAEELLGIVSTNLKTPFDMLEVIARIVDDSRMMQYKPLYGINLPCTFAQIHGHSVGIIANNNGVIYESESGKAVQFIAACNQRSIPIIFLHNVTGFMVGSRSERAGLIRHGAQFVGAIVASRVPHISIICGASYGAGNYAMCGRSYRPRFLFSWPNSRCSVMGSQQLSGVLSSIARSSAKSKGLQVDEQDVLKNEATFRDRVERDGSVWRTTAAGLDDGIIDPRDTREVLSTCLALFARQGVRGWTGMHGVSRM